VGNDDIEDNRNTQKLFVRSLWIQSTAAIAIQIGVQNLVSDVITIKKKINRNQVFLDMLPVKTSATIANKPVNKLSVMFAIIQRRIVGEVQRTKAKRNPIHGFK
jgi:hypothetical protein